jgi:hypothetical protein
MDGALCRAMQSKVKLTDGYKIRNWVDWCFAVGSFAVFVILEGALLYAYFVYLRTL